MLLVKRLLIAIDFVETTFDVNANVSVGSFSSSSSTVSSKIEEEPVEQQTEFDVILELVPSDKLISAIKCLRKVVGLGLKESKEFALSAPAIIVSAVSKDKAEEIKQIFQEVGVDVSIK